VTKPSLNSEDYIFPVFKKKSFKYLIEQSTVIISKVPEGNMATSRKTLLKSQEELELIMVVA